MVGSSVPFDFVNIHNSPDLNYRTFEIIKPGYNILVSGGMDSIWIKISDPILIMEISCSRMPKIDLTISETR
jgi:hypothetical protein